VQLGGVAVGVEAGQDLGRPRHQLAGDQIDDVQLLLDAEGEIRIQGSFLRRHGERLRHALPSPSVVPDV
jgi:hypothetical protein